MASETIITRELPDGQIEVKKTTPGAGPDGGDLVHRHVIQPGDDLNKLGVDGKPLNTAAIKKRAEELHTAAVVTAFQEAADAISAKSRAMAAAKAAAKGL